MKNLRLRKIFIFFFAIVGILTTIQLSFIYFDANFNPYAMPSFCSVNSIIDCDGIAQTIFSQFLGIPLSLWGILLYFFIMFLLFVDKLKEVKYLSILKAFKNPMEYISTLGYISFTISIILAFTSAFIIKKVCVLCVFTYFLNLLIAVIATDFSKGFLHNIKVSITDFIEDLKEKTYLIGFLIVALIATAVLTYTTLSNVFTPQVKRIKEFKHYEKLLSNNPFSATGNVLGDEKAKLTVYIYTDYECPICQTYNVIISRAATELDNVKFVHKNFPLDNDCNRTVTGPFHQNSCMLSRYAIAAENQGRMWDMNTELFEKQPTSETEVLKLAEKMGFDINKLKVDADAIETRSKLKDDIESGINLNIMGTPAIVLNGKIHSGIKPYYELKELLIKAGATEK